MTNIRKDGLKLFVYVVTISSLICELSIIFTGNSIFYFVLMWIPALAATISIIFEGNKYKREINLMNYLNKLGFKTCKLKYIFISILIPFIYLLIPYIIHWIIFPEDFAYNGVSFIVIIEDCLFPLVLGIFLGLASALGEEIGWRGYFVPTLNKIYGEKKSLIYSSAFWCLWHLPLIIGGAYLSTIPILYQVPMFTICIFPVGLICGKLALKTQSVWPSAFLHAAHNNFDQGVFQLITRGPYMYYLVSETGLFTAIAVWGIVIVYYILNRKKGIEI